MPASQIITISPDGVVSGLERKRGQGIDLKALGTASVVRVSHVVWREGARRGWAVVFLAGPRKDKVLGPADWSEDLPVDEDGAILFPDYDDAVAAEIAVLDRDRLAGRFFSGDAA